MEEVADFALDLLLPGSGAIGRYGVRTYYGKLNMFSRFFPTAYAWLFDATFGEALEASDPVGASVARTALDDGFSLDMLLRRLFGATFF